MRRFLSRPPVLLAGGGLLAGMVLAALLLPASPLSLRADSRSDRDGDGAARSVPRDGVAGPFEPSRTELAECAAIPEVGSVKHRRCIEQAWGNVVFEQGPKQGVPSFERTMSTDPAVRDNCHRIAHVMGAAAYARAKGELAEPLAHGSTACASGYYHGVLRRALDGRDTTDIVKAVRGMCDPDTLSSPFLAVQCGHGLGHAVLLNSGFDLPATLAACDSLEGEVQGACAGGAYMEIMSAEYTKADDARKKDDPDALNAAAAPQSTAARWLRKDDLVYPCNVALDRHKQVCYAMVATRIFSAVDNDWRKTGQACERSEPLWVGACFQSIGRLASATLNRDAEAILKVCNQYPRALHGDCIGAAASEYVWDSTRAERAPQLCDRIRSELQPRCYRDVGSVLSTVITDRAEHAASCRKLTTQHAKSCAAGFHHDPDPRQQAT